MPSLAETRAVATHAACVVAAYLLLSMSLGFGFLLVVLGPFWRALAQSWNMPLGGIPSAVGTSFLFLILNIMLIFALGGLGAGVVAWRIGRELPPEATEAPTESTSV